MKKHGKILILCLLVCLLLSLTPVLAAERVSVPTVEMPTLSEMVIHYTCGQKAKALRVDAAKSDEGVLSYQWYAAESETAGGKPIANATQSTYTPDTAKETGMQWYYCVVTNTLNGDVATAESARQCLVIGPTVTVKAYLSISDDDKYVTGDSGEIMALKEFEVPYFDLGLYGLERFYFSSETYGSDGTYNPGQTGPSSNLEKGTSAYAYGKVTLMHMLIYALEVDYCGVDPEDAGQGYLYQEKLLGTSVLTYTGSAGSTYMSSFWGHDENLNYYKNYAYPLASAGWGSTADQILVRENDVYCVAMFSDWSFYSNPLAGFHHLTDGEEILRSTAKQGEQKTLTLYRAYGSESGNYTTDQNLVTTGVDVYMTPADRIMDTDVTHWQRLGTTDENGQITIDTSRLSKGEYLICVPGLPGKDTDKINSCPGGIRLLVTDQAAAAPGDVSGDGKVDSSDAVLLLRSLANGETLDLAVADVNGDGRVDSSDAVLILRQLSK